MDLNPLSPLKYDHWMAKDCCLWLKSRNSLRGKRWWDLTSFRNHIDLIPTNSANNYVWETARGRGLTLHSDHYVGQGLIPIKGQKQGTPRLTICFWMHMLDIPSPYWQTLFWQSGGGTNFHGGYPYALGLTNYSPTNTTDGSIAFMGYYRGVYFPGITMAGGSMSPML